MPVVPVDLASGEATEWLTVGSGEASLDGFGVDGLVGSGVGSGMGRTVGFGSRDGLGLGFGEGFGLGVGLGDGVVGDGDGDGDGLAVGAGLCVASGVVGSGDAVNGDVGSGEETGVKPGEGRPDSGVDPFPGAPICPMAGTSKHKPASTAVVTTAESRRTCPMLHPTDPKSAAPRTNGEP